MEGDAGCGRADGTIGLGDETVEDARIGELGPDQSVERVGGPRCGHPGQGFPGHARREAAVRGDFGDGVVVESADEALADGAQEGDEVGGGQRREGGSGGA